MKLTPITSALLIASAAVLLGTSAHAQNAVYNTGDLVIGFEQQNNAAASDYVVDLGAVSQFINPSSSTLTFQLSTTDLTNAFTSSWASNSQANLVQWGLVGGGNKGTPTAASLTLNGTTIPGDTIFFTEGELTPGTQSTAPTEKSASTQNGYLGNVANFDTGSGGLAGTTTTGNGTLEAIDETHGATNSWSYEVSTKTDFGTGINIQQPTAGTGTGPTNSILDLYELTPNNGQAATYLGNFSLGSNGVLTFDALAAPEPSTYALFGLGALALLWRQRRKSSSQL